MLERKEPMGATFVVTLREAFEAALLLGIVYTYLDKVGAAAWRRYVTRGAGLGLLASAAAGWAVTVASGPLLDLGPDLVGAAILLLAVGLLTWHGWWMRRHAHGLGDEVRRRVDEAQSTGRFWLLGMIAFTGVFREGAETVLFLWGLLAQADTARGWPAFVGAVLGVATAAALGWAIFRGGRRISVRRFFDVTSVLLVLIAAGLLGTAVGKLQGLGFLPMGAPLWDTSFLLDDGGGLGGFVGGLLGYRARPSGLEVLAYLGYLVIAGALVFGVPLALRRRAPVEAARA
jgi:high-affinity iron transporter